MESGPNQNQSPVAEGSTAIEEQRQSYRYPVQPDQSAATLAIGRKRYPVKLAEESAGGFTVLTTSRIPLDPSARAKLTINSGEFDVTLVHVTPDKEGSKIGLLRVRALRGKQRASSTKQILGKSLAFALFMLLGAVMALLLTERIPLRKWMGRNLKPAARQRVTIANDPAWQRSDLPVSQRPEEAIPLRDPWQATAALV